MPEQLNRSPCTRLTSGRLLESAHPAQRERLTEPPPELLTPERAASRGLAVRDRVTENVYLHEEAPFIPGKPQLKTEKRDGQTVTTVKLDVAYTDIINRNGRYYPRSCYEAANARAEAELAEGGLWSLMDHPEWWEPVKGSLPNIVIKIEELGIDDREVEWPLGSGTKKTLGVVWAKGIIVETAKGLDAKALLKSGIKVGVSTNGWGSSQWVRAGDLDPAYYDPEELIPVTQDDFTYFSIDLVSDPSNLGGRATSERRAPAPAPEPPAPQGAPSAPSAPITPKEGTMHRLLKALLEKHSGLTLAQIKEQHASEYAEVCEKIALEQAEAPAQATAPAPVAPAAPVTAPAAQPSAPQPGTTAETSLENRVLSLTTMLENERLERIAAGRRAIVATAMEQANLPQIGTIEGIDFDARFRQRVESAAMTADSDAAAQAAVDALIQERQAYARGTQPAQAAQRPQFEHLSRAGNPGPSLPTGDTSAAPALQEGYAPMRDAFADLR